MANATAPGFILVPYPEKPLEEVYVPQRISRGLRSRHTADLRWLGRVIAAFVMLPLAFLLFWLLEPVAVLLAGWTWDWLYAALTAILRGSHELPPWSGGDSGKLGPALILGMDQFAAATEHFRSEFVTAVFTAVVAAFATIYQLGKQRFSTVDVFSSEIAARMRILAADNSVPRIIDSLHHPLHAVAVDTGKPTNNRKYKASDQSQFDTFQQRSSDLGALSSSVVDHVTAFYSFHRAARDELRDLEDPVEEGSEGVADLRGKVINVLFMVDLMALNGLKSLDDLVETPEHQLHCRQICLCVGTRANAFLIENMASSDHRYAEVRLRNQRYAWLTAELKAAIKRLPQTTKGRDFF